MDNMEILKKYAQTNHFGKFLGLKLELVEPGEVNYFVEVSQNHLNRRLKMNPKNKQ